MADGRSDRAHRTDRHTDALTVWDFVWAVVVVASSFLVATAARTLLRRVLRRFEGIPDTYLLLISRAVGWFIVVVGIIYALGILGVDLGPAMIALLIVAAVAFFAGRGLLEDFGAGLILQGTPMFDVGDQIETAAGNGHRPRGDGTHRRPANHGWRGDQRPQ